MKNNNNITTVASKGQTSVKNSFFFTIASQCFGNIFKMQEKSKKIVGWCIFVYSFFDD